MAMASTHRSPQTPCRQEQLEGLNPCRSRFQRAMSELGVAVIQALRWRLRGALSTCFRRCRTAWPSNCAWREPVAWLKPTKFWKGICPSCNRRFGVEAAQQGGSAASGSDLNYLKTQRRLKADSTILHGGSLASARSCQSPKCDRRRSARRIACHPALVPCASLQTGSSSATQTATATSASQGKTLSPGGSTPGKSSYQNLQARFQLQSSDATAPPGVRPPLQNFPQPPFDSRNNPMIPGIQQPDVFHFGKQSTVLFWLDTHLPLVDSQSRCH